MIIWPIVVGVQPSGSAMCPARRRRRSVTPRRSLMSASSVFNSTRRSVRVAGCQATRSTIPRSPKWLNETSGRTSQPARRRSRVTDSDIVACPAEINRSTPAPRQRGSSTSRTSSTAATFRIRLSATPSKRPSSIWEYVVRETPALAATTYCGQPSRIRSFRSSRPMPRSSIVARWWRTSLICGSTGLSPRMSAPRTGQSRGFPRRRRRGSRGGRGRTRIGLRR